MSLSENPPQTTPSGASGTVPAKSKLEKAIDSACPILDALSADESWIKDNLCTFRAKVCSSLWQEGDSNLRARIRNESEFRIYVTSGSDEEQELIELLKSMARKEVPWKLLFENKAFLKPEPEKSTDPAVAHATLHAWKSEFKGSLSRALLYIIAGYLSKDITPYARLTTIVNSSGTGKSRMVDQLGTEVVTVTVCLRRMEDKGFPPADDSLRNWLISDTGHRATVQKRLHGFAYSLLMTTYDQLQIIAKQLNIYEGPSKELYEENPEECASIVIKRQKKLASAFREHMAEDLAYHIPNSNRKTFYDQVETLANEFVKGGRQADDEDEPQHSLYVRRKNEGLQKAGNILCRFLDEHGVLNLAKGPRRPLVVLAFDEADVLTDNLPGQDHWNLFSELRRVLRRIMKFSILSLFLSTGGHFNKFSPDIHSDTSGRARDPRNHPLDPILECSFDEIAYPAPEDTIAMNRVVEIDWISHLGRPLFGSYWDYLPDERKGDESMILDFVKEKLLDGPTVLGADDRTGSLACLSTRFALEFNMDGTARDVTNTQVEKHMRLCIGSTTGFETLITTSGSEPILAEAAYELLKDSGTNAVHRLAEHSDLNCIDRGRRGELVAALLIMQAYDAARVLSGKRWVSVLNFMEALLPDFEYNILRRSMPTTLSKRSRDPDQKTFEVTFKDYGMWFNHIIKIERKEMISIDHLWKFVVRGAMILCATNQEGIDIILPLAHITKDLGPDTVTAIIIQVKNAKSYKATLQEDLFDAMDYVVTPTIFSKAHPPRIDCDPDPDSDSDSKSTVETLLKTSAEPSTKRRKVSAMPKVAPEPVMVNPKAVIRMVFALASPEPAVVFRSRPDVNRHMDGLTFFDIWLAGLSNVTFRQTGNADLTHYETLLERSLSPHGAFELKGIPGMGKKAKKMRRACRQRMAPLTSPEPAYHTIHRSLGEESGEALGGQPGVASGSH